MSPKKEPTTKNRRTVHPIPAGPESAPSIAPEDFKAKSPLKDEVAGVPSTVKEGFATRKPLPA